MYSVYIIDDEKLVVDDLINSLPWLENGFEVIGFETNSIKAIEEITEKNPDVVFADLKMPACDGIELIKRVKKNKADAEFVILSAYEDFKASREFFLMGGFDYINKPLDQMSAAMILEKLSRKLVTKYDKTPINTFIPSKSSKFDDLVNYITINFSKKHTLADLSERFNVSQTYICDLFSKHYNSTFTIFITNLRMTEAVRLTLETDTPLKEIAIYCGYSKYSHFCKVFKNSYGKSPSLYREDGG